MLLTYYDSVRWGRKLTEAELIERFRAELEAAGFSDHYQRELYQEKGMEELRQFVAAAELSNPEVLTGSGSVLTGVTIRAVSTASPINRDPGKQRFFARKS